MVMDVRFSTSGGVAGEINNTDIVAIDQCSMARRVAKLKKQLT
jgi:hypothetical protein